ncbi:MAG: AAA family ATPase, partial [Aeromicrobium sp.]
MPHGDGWGASPVTIERPRLLSRLQEAPPTRVVLVTAPAGSGKTALLTQWTRELLHDDAAAVMWVTCDEVADSPADFWSAVRQAVAGSGDTAVRQRWPAAADGPRSRPKDVIRRLEDVGRPAVLVLDDFHLVVDRECLAEVSFLAHHLPPGVRLAVSSRFDPSVRLTKLHLDGQVRELRFADLAFTPDEVEQLVTARGIDLSREDSDLLHQRTEGWVAGVQLCLMTMNGSRPPEIVVRDLSSNDASIAGYLMEQVLAEMDPESRAFLLDTSVVDEITPELAEQLTGRRDSAAMLQRLADRTGFMFPLAGSDHGYRYHALFAGLLRSEHRLTDRGRHELLQRRVAQVLIGADRSAEALPHAVAAESWDTAAAALFDVMARDLGAGRHADLAPWVAQFPTSRLQSDPRVTLVAGCLALLGDDVDRARVLVEQALDSPAMLNPTQRRRCQSVRLILLALCHRFDDDHEAVVRVLSADGPARAPAASEGDSIEASIRSCWYAVRAAGLVRTGLLAEAAATAERALLTAPAKRTWGVIDALETLTLGALLDGDLRSAREHADAAWELLASGCARYVGRPMTLHVSRVWAALDEGRFDDAAQAMVDAHDPRFGDLALRDRLAIRAAEVRIALHRDGDARKAMTGVAVLSAARLPVSWLSEQLLAFLTVECLVTVGQFDGAASTARRHEALFPLRPGVVGLSAWVRARELLAQLISRGVRGVENDPRLSTEWARHAELMSVALASPLVVRGALGVRFLLTGAAIEFRAGRHNEASRILNVVLDEAAFHGWRLPFYELGDSIHGLLRSERDRISEHGGLLTQLVQELHTR